VFLKATDHSVVDELESKKKPSFDLDAGIVIFLRQSIAFVGSDLESPSWSAPRARLIRWRYSTPFSLHSPEESKRFLNYVVERIISWLLIS
jgi:hypothetical protein